MKNFLKIFVLETAAFVAAAAIFNGIFLKKEHHTIQERNIAANRICADISAAADKNTAITEVINENFFVWTTYHGGSELTAVDYIPTEDIASSISSGNENCIICGLSDQSGSFSGLVKCSFRDDKQYNILLIVNGFIAFCWLVSSLVLVYVNCSIIRPFVKLSEYPEKLAKFQISEKLPETKNRHFGKYIWGMNMLNDLLENDRRNINHLEYQRQTMLASIAHGVKTPVANIRLYVEALRTGVYKGSATDAAEKIDGNARKIEELTAKLLEVSSSAVTNYEINIHPFYLKELAELVKNEFANRLETKHIPYMIECIGNPLIESDQAAIFRAISQIIENAVKYGDGNGIHIQMLKQDDGLCISIKNKGALLNENELPFVFKSYWRGSNSTGIEGSGIGLYTARELIKALDGSIFVRCSEETSEMEFVIFIENI